MSDNYSEEKKLVYDTTMSLYHGGFIRASSGNVSSRVQNTEFMAITPTGVRYDLLKVEDIVICDLDGALVEGTLNPSSEFRMHAAIYKAFSHINGVVHTHSPFVITFAALEENIPMVSIEGLMVGSNILPVTERFSIPGSQEVGESALSYFRKNPDLRGLILSNHGLLTIGEKLASAMSLAESIELEAQVYYQAQLIGTPKLISEEQRKIIIETYMKGKLK